jgi:large subunit ribosomal protein L5
MAEKEQDKEKKPPEKKPAAPKPAGEKAPKGEGKKAAVKAEAGEQVKPSKLRLKERYFNEIVPALQEKLSLKNRLAVPRLTKVCLNMGFGKAATENQPRVGEMCVVDLTQIAGQKAVVTLSTKSVSNFKLRAGMQVGCRVTLRGAKMYEFLDRLFSVALPRVRDFRGLSPRAFDGRGNYSLGVLEQNVFPEIESDRMEFIHGMDITICTTAKKDEHARELLRAMGCPFRAN